ncbi:DNA-binding transcriptional regulator, LysR family [Collimonas sp. OK607]|uniref:LysR family transcriptional regulator n=1 Tax=Collimonas sp. OK607 TaxID=1798194 RepID=UPI0008DFC561|nr:LysR family transcriptional regulator [Collimonas sp. OK607]SFB28612.1 DNA-binding transcriptional regulator, LysR family [Collimonas sp. OK607]
MSQLDFDERDLRSLRIFCTVAEAGGFAAAEQRLNMSKASISRHIRMVEERLGVRLCERGPAGFKLSAAGIVALDLASVALKSLGRIRPEIDSVRGVLSGTLSIGMSEQLLTHPDCRIPEALAELKRRAPDVQPEVVAMTFANLSQALRERRLEVAIRGMYKRDPLFNYRALFVEIHRVYTLADAAQKKGLHTKSLLPVVYRPHPFVEQTLAVHGYERGPDAGGLEAIGLLVATGNYAGLLPEHYANMVGHRYVLEALADGPVFHNTICAITEASRPLTRRLELFLDILDELHDCHPGQ